VVSLLTFCSDINLLCLREHFLRIYFCHTIHNASVKSEELFVLLLMYRLSKTVVLLMYSLVAEVQK
jgi:hypothetical protein